MEQNQFLQKVRMKVVAAGCTFIFYAISFFTSFFPNKILMVFSLAAGLFGNILVFINIKRGNFIGDCDERDKEILYKTAFDASLWFMAILLSVSVAVSIIFLGKDNVTLSISQITTLIWMIVMGYQVGIYGSFYMKEKKENAE